MAYRLAADAVVILHGLFVLFVVLGALPVLRWPRLAWLHVPAALWGIAIEWGGWVCPLTPLENRLRRLGGEAGYHGGFVEHYVMPVLYPDGLTHRAQLVLGAAILAINLVLYTFVLRKVVRRRGARK